MTPIAKRLIQFGLMLVVVGLLFAARFSPVARSVVAEFWAPTVEAREAVDGRTREAARFTKSKIELIREIETLEAELQDQARRNNQADIWRRENEELRGLLNAPLAPGYDMVIAHIVTRDPAAAGRRLRLDRGSSDGLAIGQAVTARGYLLGRVLEVSPHSAVVLTIADPNCRVSAKVELDGERVEGILAGRGHTDYLAHPIGALTHLPRDLDYPEDLLVATSGYSPVIPPGIPIGKISPDRRGDMVTTVDNLYKNVTVIPFVFNQDFRFVTVWIRWTPEAAPPRRAADSTEPLPDTPAEETSEPPAPVDPAAPPEVLDVP